MKHKIKKKRFLNKLLVFTLIVASLFIFTIPLNLIALFISMNHIETNKFYLATSVIAIMIILFNII